MKLKIVSILFLSAAWLTSRAQDAYTIKQISITVEGTSTLHDWEMKTTTVKGQGSFVVENSKVTSIKEVSLVLPVESLKSDKESMDKNAYKSLKSEKYKSITFNLIKVTNASPGTVTIEGKLEIAGVTKPISLTATYTVTGNNLQFKGEKSLLMSEFNIEPPTFMFGSIKTGDSIKIVFDVTFSKNSTVATN